MVFRQSVQPQARRAGPRSNVVRRCPRIWIQYRGGPSSARFSPAQPLIYSDPRSPLSPWAPGWTPPTLAANGELVTKATWSEPGTYVLRAIAHDGYNYSSQEVRVTVN